MLLKKATRGVHVDFVDFGGDPGKLRSKIILDFLEDSVFRGVEGEGELGGEEGEGIPIGFVQD
jgi:hypothetical protein